MFEWARRRYRQLFPPRERGSFLDRPLNNAVVLSYGRYLRGLRFHQAIYRCLSRDLGAFISLYRSFQRRPEALAGAAASCGVNAPKPQRM